MYDKKLLSVASFAKYSIDVATGRVPTHKCTWCDATTWYPLKLSVGLSCLAGSFMQNGIMHSCLVAAWNEVNRGIPAGQILVLFVCVLCLIFCTAVVRAYWNDQLFTFLVLL